MELKEAIRLVADGVEKTTRPQVWADYGAGRGLFTKAMGTLLAPGSLIYAIDNDAVSLDSISFDDDRIQLKKLRSDFVKDDIDIKKLDGVLMANSLHYAKDPVMVLRNIRKNLSTGGRLIVLEYERINGNQWVPFPVNFGRLSELSKNSGFADVVKLAETPSAFQQGNIYAALIRY